MLKELLQAFHNFTQYTIEDFYIVETPCEFYSRVLEKIRSSTAVYLACLVLGAGDDARKVIDALAERMEGDRKTVLMIDRSRNMGNPRLVAYLSQKNLWPIVKLVDMSKCRFLPHMCNELLGVYHLKAYVFDDEVCVSGANLDDSYFVDRIDRYYFLRSRELASSLVSGIFEIMLGHKHLSKQRMKPAKKLQTAQAASLPSSESAGSNGAPVTKVFSFSKDEELYVLERLLGFKYKEICISTAYLNFSNRHLSILRKLPFSLFVPSVKAITFNNASLLGSVVREIYGYSSYKTKGYLPHVDLNEYERQGYSFHAKGIWLFGEDLFITVIGSSNFNRRSVRIDEECTWVIASNNPSIGEKLYEEVNSLKAYSKPVHMEELRRRKVRWIIVIIFHLMNIFI